MLHRSNRDVKGHGPNRRASGSDFPNGRKPILVAFGGHKDIPVRIHDAVGRPVGIEILDTYHRSAERRPGGGDDLSRVIESAQRFSAAIDGVEGACSVEARGDFIARSSGVDTSHTRRL